VVVKNGGRADAGKHILVLAVDGNNVAEEAVSGLKAGQEREVRVEGVRLKQGQHTLSATVDPEKAVAESDEGNNALKVTASCKDDD
jgi:subtilase family serine protease